MGNTSSADENQLSTKEGTAGTWRERSWVAVGGRHDKVLDDLLDDLLQGERSFLGSIQVVGVSNGTRGNSLKQIEPHWKLCSSGCLCILICSYSFVHMMRVA